MALDTSAVQSFSDAELLVLYRNALAQLAVSQSTNINGQMITRAQLPQVREMVEWLETRINNAASSATATEGGNVAYAKFNDPT